MEIFLLVIFWLLPIFGYATAEEEPNLNSTIISKNNLQFDNFNSSLVNSGHNRDLENDTKPLQETKVKTENINPIYPLVQVTSSENRGVSINDTTEDNRIRNNNTVTSYSEESNTTNIKSTESNSRKRKNNNEEFSNITQIGGKDEKTTNHSMILSKLQNTRNETKHPLFSVAPRSRKFRKSKLRKSRKSGSTKRVKVKLVDKNEDYGRGCFEHLRKQMGSKACYKVQCAENGLKFIVEDEDNLTLKPVAEFEVGRGLKTTKNCLTVSRGDPTSKVCIKWKDMKWSMKKFKGCVTADVSKTQDETSKPNIMCYVLNCEELKWKSKWLLPTTPSPLGLTEKQSKEGKRKHTFSKPAPNPSSVDNPNLRKPSDELLYTGAEKESDPPSRVFDYIETLPPLTNVDGNPVPVSIGSDGKLNLTSENKPQPEKNKKPVKNKKPGDEKKPGNKKKPGNQNKPGNKKTPGNKKKPGHKKNPGGEQKPGNKKNPGNKKKPGQKKNPGDEQKPGNKKKPGHKKIPGDEQKPGNKKKPGDEQKPGNRKKPGDKKPPGNKKKPGDKKKPGNKKNPGNKQGKNSQNCNNPNFMNKPGPKIKFKPGNVTGHKCEPGKVPVPGNKPGNKCKPGKGPKPGNKRKSEKNPNPAKNPNQKWHGKPTPNNRIPRVHDQHIKNVQPKNNIGEFLTTKNGTNTAITAAQNKEKINSKDGGMKRVGETSAGSSLSENNQETALSKPEIFSFDPFKTFNIDPQVVYILETSEKIDPKLMEF